MSETQKTLSCSECGVFNCRTLDRDYPDFCLTKAAKEDNEQVLNVYREHPEYSLVAKASAQVEGIFYRQMNRVEEILEFSRRMNFKKIGVATCAGLIEEAKVFARIAQNYGFNCYTVICKVGGTDKSAIGIAPDDKINKGKKHESLCNPILQARLLNKEKTDLNVLVGLCVGHDSLFYRHSEALVTTLLTKDRVLGHNPAAALYTVKSYNKHLLTPRE